MLCEVPNHVDIALPDRYRLAADPLLGEGGMGRVLRAVDVVLDTPVALKIVKPSLAADRRFRKLFELEVRISARFAHPHVVPLHDHGETPDGTPFLGLAFADAGSFAALRRHPGTWPELLRLTSELLDALGHLHAREVLHRDLKPENVLLHRGDDGVAHVWLADLGLANATSSLVKKKGRMEGTPGFMAPEQFLGQPREYGPWTDLYSLGVILWEIFTGRRPFGDDETALSAPLPHFAPRQGLALPEGIDAILGNLLHPEPLSRYDLAADLLTELGALGRPITWRQTGEPVTLRTVAPSAQSCEVFDDLGELSDGGSANRSTLADLKAAEVRAGQADPQIPRWNRPLPRNLPTEPPAECGYGAIARASLSLFAIREVPLVAREPERRELWSAARAVAETGRPGVVVVVGEAGSGKSRLVESVAKALEEGGWAETTRLVYQRSPGREDGYAGAARALLKPWNETRDSLTARLRRRLSRERHRLDDRLEEEAQSLAKWCGLLEEDEEPVPAGLGLREIHRTLAANAWRGLAVLLLEDAQWAREDGDGLAIAEALLQGAHETTSRPTLMLMTLRREDLQRDADLRARVDALVAQGARRVDLVRLDRRGTEALLGETLTLAPALAARVAERCEGNPLFARQLLIAWADQGWLVDQGRLQFGLATDVDVDAVIPADAEALLRERIHATTEASGSARRFRDTLHLAALAGRSLPRDLLLTLAGPDVAPFAQGCGLWVPSGEGLSFDSSLLHQAALAEAKERSDVSFLHRRLGRAWARYGEASGQSVDLDVGRHAHLGRDHDYALPHLMRAADSAWQRGRPRELDEASHLALASAERSEDASGLGWAHLWRGRALAALGDPQRAAEQYEHALHQFEQNQTPTGTVSALIALGQALLNQGNLAGSEARYTTAIDRARALEDVEAEAEALAGKAWLEQQKRNFEGADILFTRVVARLEQLDDLRGVAAAILGQAFVARRTGAFEEADELYEEAVVAFREGDDLLGTARALMGRGIAARQRRNFDLAHSALRDAQKLGEELGATTVLMEARLALADLHRVRGARERAQQMYEAQAGWAERQNQFQSAIMAHLGLALVARESQDLHAMHEAATAASRHLERVPGHWLWATYRMIVATFLAMQEEHEQTWNWLWSASEMGLGDTVDADTADCLVQIVEIASQCGWENVTRLSSKLADAQLEALGQNTRRAAVKQLAKMTRDIP